MPPHFRAGDLVVVRDLPGILRSLDATGALDGLPLMPEMARHAGRTFRVSRRLERTCLENNWRPHAFPADDVVELEELRCDGSAHDGCQRGCMLLWREAWLEPAAVAGAGRLPAPATSEPELARLKTREGDRYVCQSTELHRATRVLSRPARVMTFVREVLVGNRSIMQMAGHVLRIVPRRIKRKYLHGDPAGPCLRTPTASLGLQPGDVVQIRPFAEIRDTLDARGKNRGLEFPVEFKAFAGRTYRVRSRLERMINETTGRMRRVEHTVSLEGVRCQCYHRIGGCPRRELLYWREIWLRRADHHEFADVRLDVPRLVDRLDQQPVTSATHQV